MTKADLNISKAEALVFIKFTGANNTALYEMHLPHVRIISINLTGHACV